MVDRLDAEVEEVGSGPRIDPAEVGVRCMPTEVMAEGLEGEVWSAGEALMLDLGVSTYIFHGQVSY